MQHKPLLLTASLTAAMLLTVSTASHAEILSIGKNVKIATKTETPRRGLTKQHVMKKFGKAKKTIVSSGKVTKRNPRITRWNYDNFSVIFENNHVVHTVVHR